jgi:hypothetical protein
LLPRRTSSASARPDAGALRPEEALEVDAEPRGEPKRGGPPRKTPGAAGNRCARQLKHPIERFGTRVCDRFGLEKQFAAGLAPLADWIHQGLLLIQALVESLRKAKIILPGMPVLEPLRAEVLRRAQRRLYKRLTAPLSEGQKQQLETVLNLREGTRQTLLAWLRQPAGALLRAASWITSPSSKRCAGSGCRPTSAASSTKIASFGSREGAQTTVYQLKDFEAQRRQATLVAILLDTQATLIDEILDLHDRMIRQRLRQSQAHV